MTIKKEVSTSATGPWSANTSANPGAALYYNVTVLNPGVSDAEEVVVTDIVPAYTTLYNTGSIIATVSYNSATADNITQGIDDENPNEASGDTTGVDDGSTMKFYLGTGQDGTDQSGGIMGGGKSAVIKYRVTID